MSDYEIQFQADLERAQALSLESLALEQFRRKQKDRAEKMGKITLRQNSNRDSTDGGTPPALPPPPSQRRSSRTSQRTSFTEQTPLAIPSEVKSNSSSPTRENDQIENNDLISFTSPKSKKENPALETFKEYIDQISKLGQVSETMPYPPKTITPDTPPTPSVYYQGSHNYTPTGYNYGFPQGAPVFPGYSTYPRPYSVPHYSYSMTSPTSPDIPRPPFISPVPFSQTRMATPAYVGYPPPRQPQPHYNYSTTNMISRPIRPQAVTSPSIYPQLNNLSLNSNQPASSFNPSQNPPIQPSPEGLGTWEGTNSSRPDFSRKMSEVSNASNESNDAVGDLPNLIDFSKNSSNNRGSVRVSVLEAFDPLLGEEGAEYMIGSEYSNSSVYEEYDPLDFLYGETQLRETAIYSSVNKRETMVPSPPATILPPVPKPQTTNKLYDSITKMRTRNYDIEHRAFLDMVLELRSEFEYTDPKTNPGYIIASRSSGKYPPNTSIKLMVHHSFSNEPITFTCDIESTIEHVILHIGCTLEGEIKEDMSQYMLRVWGENSYLYPGSSLSEYDYIRQCIRLEKDVRLCLHNERDTSFARTELDDVRDRNITMEDIMPVNGTTLMLSFDNLSILLETLEGELSRAVGEMRSEGYCSPIGVVQALKAICALTSGIETLHLSNARENFAKACNNQGNNQVLKPEIISDSRGDYVGVNVRAASAAERLAKAASKLRDAVRSLIHTYTRTNLVDFCLSEPSYDSPCDPHKAVPSHKLHELTLFCIEAIHRPMPCWTFNDYIISAVCYHGTRRLRAPRFTSVANIETNGFYPRIMFDNWLTIDDLPISCLPKETRLVLTLYGRTIEPDDQQNSDNKTEGDHNDDNKDAISDVIFQHKELGWAAIQMFNYDGVLASGYYYLPLWPSSSDKRLGPAPHHMHAPSYAHPIIHIEIPQYTHTGVRYSDGEVEAESRPHDDLRPFESLDGNTQSQLLHLVEQGAYQRMPVECREILWEKREYLVDVPGALTLVLLAASNWHGEHRRQLISLVKRWNKPSPLNAIHLLLPCFPDEDVRTIACELINEMDDNSLCRVLPQLVSALRHEPKSNLCILLLRRALGAPALAHSLYWLLQHNIPNSNDDQLAQNSESVEEGDQLEDANRWTPRYELVARALIAIVGQALAEKLQSQMALVQELSDLANAIKSSKEGHRGRTLAAGAEQLALSLRSSTRHLPVALAAEVHAVDVKSCSYFASNTLPLKINFIGRDNAIIPAMFKVGDDLRQDALVLQVIKVLDSLWLKEGVDLRMVSFQAVPTQHKKGMIEIVTEAETLRVIQTEFGLTGSFKDRPIAEWLAKHNPSELEYERARDNFTASCAGYSVVTYLLGICDRHNDNIMLKKSGHLFHIDFGKFLGDAQMFGNFKRDRAPFVLTPDMAYVINGGERPSQRFHYFVELCCMAYNVARQHRQHLLDLFALMSGTGASAVAYVRSALLPEATQAEAAAAFARLIHSSLKSKFTPINFFLHNLAQLRTSGDQNNSSSELLSFMPRTYTMASEGRLLSVEVLGFEKRYDPDKHYVYALRVHRAGQATPLTLYRTYKHFTELYQKICLHFPLAKVHSLPIGLHVGRSNVRQVAERRFRDIQAFLTSLFSLADEIAHSDLVYTFFHPLLRDQQDMTPQRTRNRAEIVEQENEGSGALKISVQYTAGVLSVLILHAQSLAFTPQGVPPNPYVKVYLIPDPSKETKRKTRVLKRNSHPSFMEMLEYRLPLETILDRVLQATVWHYDSLQENTFLGGVEISLATLPLRRETVAWYPLQYVTR